MNGALREGITLRYAITQFALWYSSIVGAQAHNVIHYADAKLKILEITEAMRDWLGQDLLNMHFMEFNETIKELQK